MSEAEQTQKKYSRVDEGDKSTKYHHYCPKQLAKGLSMSSPATISSPELHKWTCVRNGQSPNGPTEGSAHRASQSLPNAPVMAVPAMTGRVAVSLGARCSGHDRLF